MSCQTCLLAQPARGGGGGGEECKVVGEVGALERALGVFVGGVEGSVGGDLSDEGDLQGRGRGCGISGEEGGRGMRGVQAVSAKRSVDEDTEEVEEKRQAQE